MASPTRRIEAQAAGIGNAPGRDAGGEKRQRNGDSDGLFADVMYGKDSKNLC